jgi:hypothetical protein
MADVLLAEITLPSCIIPESLPVRLTEATFKISGYIWRIYQNDADPFPSNPHAHDVENGYKMDLGNGNLYRSTRCTGDAVKKKDLLELRAQAEQKGVVLPALTIKA